MPSPVTSQKQFRIAKDNVTVRSAEDGTGTRVQGHAAVFNVESSPLWELGGATELLMPGCFRSSLANPQTIVKLLINHDPNLVLASCPGTLSLREDATGLYFEALLGSQTYALDLAESMRRGDLNKCSFAFTIDDASFENVNGTPCQVIRACSLSDASVVCWPAYEQTDASLRTRYQELIAELTAEKHGNLNITATGDEGSEPDAQKTQALNGFHRRAREIELLAVR